MNIQIKPHKNTINFVHIYKIRENFHVNNNSKDS